MVGLSDLSAPTFCGVTSNTVRSRVQTMNVNTFEGVRPPHTCVEGDEPWKSLFWHRYQIMQMEFLFTHVHPVISKWKIINSL